MTTSWHIFSKLLTLMDSQGTCQWDSGKELEPQHYVAPSSNIASSGVNWEIHSINQDIDSGVDVANDDDAIGDIGSLLDYVSNLPTCS